MNPERRAARGLRLLQGAGYTVLRSVVQGRQYLEVTADASGPFTYGARVVRIGVQYPPSGWFRPMVVLHGADLPRHQNVYTREICVVDNAVDLWNEEEDTEVFLLQQAIRLLRDTEVGPQAVRLGEVDAPEPLSAQLQYEPGSRAFLPDLERASDGGKFQGFLSQPGAQPTLVVTSFDDVYFERMAVLATFLGANRPITGRFKKVATRPHVGVFQNEDDTTRWFQESIGTAYRSPKQFDILRKDKSFTIVSLIIYPDEAVERNKRQLTGVVRLEVAQNGRTPKRTFYKPEVFPPNGNFVRMPGCELLQDLHVAVVGCGAIGSALAASLCRVGVGEFTLIDMEQLNLDNLVRYEALIQGVGLCKAIALQHHLFAISPYAKVNTIIDRFGGILNPTEDSQYESSIKSVQGADVIVCATGSTASMRSVADAFPNKKVIFVWAGPGALGGRIWKQMPDQACFHCFCWYGPTVIGELPDNGEAPVYPTGCGFPTFTGRMHDLEIIAQWATKIIVSNSLHSPEWTATDNAFLVDGLTGIVSHWCLEPHQKCARHIPPGSQSRRSRT